VNAVFQAPFFLLACLAEQELRLYEPCSKADTEQ
jgi:hypothetical protein